MTRGNILISGGGIGGLTLGILLKEHGYEPLVVERDQSLRQEGYMMDFFGSAFDVAERLGLVPALQTIHYPIDQVEYVDDAGKVYASMPVANVSRALGGRYLYLRRSDLEHILYERAVRAGVEIRFGSSVAAIEQTDSAVSVRFEDGNQGKFALVIGADGLHSRIRALVFGEERQFARFLGGYVAALHMSGYANELGRTLKMHEATDRLGMLYPLGGDRVAATYILRHPEANVPRERQLEFLRQQFSGSGWILERVLDDQQTDVPIYFDSLTQIVMPQWHKGRAALLGDACGCLTLLAGQGSHMAMAGAYILAENLARRGGDHTAAFAAYQGRLQPEVGRRQRDAAMLLNYLLPTRESHAWLRRLVLRSIFSPLVFPVVLRWFGAKGVLAA